MDLIKLPFWLGGVELGKLRDAAENYWTTMETWITWPLTQFDPLTCSINILYLLAYQRDIQRFKGEPLELFRKRIAFAYINASEAGSKAGFIAIFERLGVGYMEADERVDPVDWDVILLRLSDSQLAENIYLLQRIINKYGRTCRRYQLQTITPVVIATEVKSVGHIWWFDVAEQQLKPWSADETIDNRIVANQWDLDVARL